MNGADALVAQGRALLEREAASLDDKRWDDWLALFAKDCVYWVPTWRNDDTLASDPEAEVSHIYYASRAGLEDRVVRIRSRRSPASMPSPRTTHFLGNVIALEPPTGEQMRLRASWMSQVYFPRSRETHPFFGSAEVELVRGGENEGAEGWLIRKKKIVLQNDFIPTMLDVYCI